MLNIKNFNTFVKENIDDNENNHNINIQNNDPIDNYLDIDDNELRLDHNPDETELIGESNKYISELDDYNLVDIFQEKEI